MKYTPIWSNILVEIDAPPGFKGSVVALPEETLEKYTRYNCTGTVLAIGARAFSPPIGDGTALFQVGDRVLFKQHAGVRPDKEIGTELLRIMHDTDVVAIITD